MAFQINQISFDFHSGNGTVSLFEQPVPPINMGKSVNVNFPLKPKPTGGTPDNATEVELKAEAKATLQAAISAL